jgi:hypothetical protein
MLHVMTVVRAVVECLIALAVVARVSRFGAEDILPEATKGRVVRWLAGRGRREASKTVSAGLSCRWCWSVWAAVPTVSIWYMISGTPHVWDRWYVDVPALILALSYAEALIRRLEPED